MEIAGRGVRTIFSGKLFIQKRFYLVLGLIIVTIFTGMATGFALFYRLIYVMALTAVLAFIWNWITMRGLDIEIERRTRRVRVGDDIEERIVVRNNSRLPKPTLEVEDITDMPGYSNGMALSLSNNSFRSWLARAPARKRGAYTLGPVRVSNTDLFGLFRRERDFGGQDSLLVYPPDIRPARIRDAFRLHKRRQFGAAQVSQPDAPRRERPRIYLWRQSEQNTLGQHRPHRKTHVQGI